jgi:hypothetical protein
MRTGRPRTPIGTHGAINTRREGGRVVAETRIRDLDGRLRQVRASGPTAAAARTRLMERIRERPSLPSAGVLRPTSPFADLADLWLVDLEQRDLAGNTKENYRTCLRLHVRPAFEHYTLAEVTTGRVEWFLAKQAKVSQSQAKQTRTLLNMLFGYALRHDAIARNPVEGTSQLRRTKATPQALTIEQITAIRKAAAQWRSEPGLPGPKPDGQVRDIIEILLGTAMRTGEVLALRPCDIEELPSGMVAGVNGTVVQRKGSGAERGSPSLPPGQSWAAEKERFAASRRRRWFGTGSHREVRALNARRPSPDRRRNATVRPVSKSSSASIGPRTCAPRLPTSRCRSRRAGNRATSPSPRTAAHRPDPSGAGTSGLERHVATAPKGDRDVLAVHQDVEQDVAVVRHDRQAPHHPTSHLGVGGPPRPRLAGARPLLTSAAPWSRSSPGHGGTGTTAKPTACSAPSAPPFTTNFPWRCPLRNGGG